MTMGKRSVTVSALCLAVLLSLAGTLSAGGGDDPWAEVHAKMTSEGWKQISDAVFERQLGPSKVEHLGFGREGLAWTISELNRQLAGLQKEYSSYPSEDLARTIDELSLTIDGAKRELASLPVEPAKAALALEAASCSSICYSATADAYPLTGTQGVGAVANAQFSSTCGYTGSTYAYAYARATAGTTTTTVTQQDPRTGTNVTSSATATVYGGSIAGTPCYSTANSYAQNSSLGISYTTSDVNDGVCPAPANLAVTIQGTSFEYFTAPGCRNRTWTSSVSGGNGIYSYQWKYNGTNVGTGSTYTRSVCNSAGSFQLRLDVSDSNGVTGFDTHDVSVEYEPGG